MSRTPEVLPMPSWLRFLRRCRSVLWTAIFLVVVSVAVVVGLGRAFTPYAHHLQPLLEQRLSLALGQPVKIGRLSAEWQGLDPHLDLHDLRLGAAGALHLRQARLRFHVLHWLLPRRDDWSLELSGLRLSLERDLAGRWQLQGFRNQDGEPADFRQLLQLGDVTVRNSQLFILGLGEPREINLRQVLLRQVGQGLVLDGELGLVQAPPIQLKMLLEQSLDATAQTSGTQPGIALQAYLEAQQQPVAAWLALVGPAWREQVDRLPAQGTTDIRLWLQSNAQDQAEVTLQLGLVQGQNQWQTQAWLEWTPEDWRLSLSGLGPSENALDSAPVIANRVKLPKATPGGGWLRWHQQRAKPAAEMQAPEVDVIEAGATVELAGDQIDLAYVPLLAQWWPEAPDMLRQTGLSGMVNEIHGRRGADGRWQDLSARFDAIALPTAGQLPGCQGLSGQLQLQDGQGALQLSGGQLHWTRVFPHPLPVQALALNFELVTPSDGPWRFSVPQLRWDTGAFALEANLRYISGQSVAGGAAVNPDAAQRDWLEMNLASSGFSISDAKNFLPLGVMGKRTGAWLQTGLHAGEIRDLRAVFQGRPSDWPFLKGEGRFHASAQVIDTEIAFSPDWPLVENLNGRLSFSPKAMHIDDARVRFAGAPVQQLSAVIADTDSAVLELELSSTSDAKRHLQMLGRLPLRAGAWVADTDLRLSGPSKITANLNVDFRDGRSDASVRGHARFDGVQVNYNNRVELADLVGGFDFDNAGLHPAQLQSRWQEHEAQLNFGSDPFSVALSGYFDIDEVLAVAGVDPLWQQYLQGQSLWHWHLTPASRGSFLQAESDLLGVRVLLPDPLAKLASTPRRLQLAVPFGDEIPVHIRFGGELDATVLLDDGGSVAGVSLELSKACADLASGVCPAAAPARTGSAWLGGAGSLADLIGWVDVIETLAAASGDPANAMDWRGNASFDRLQLLGRYFSQARMDFARSGEHWSVGFNGPEIRGRVRLPAGDSASNTVVAEFERLHLPTPPASLANAPATDPKAMPALHLYAEDLQWEDWPVGELQVQAFPVADGLRFETIEASNPVFKLTGQGEWLRHGEATDSQLRLRVDAEQLGRLMETLGYGAVVEGGQSSIHLDGRWHGGPADFALARLEGSLEVNVVQGRFPEAGPGAGRMLGLMSIQAIPRRILLDFRDVFETGLNFDRLHGVFQLAGGYALTDGLEINSTAAKIVISGRTDLVKREYDQTVSIRPGLGSTLPVIGAIAGGPVGATAGLALQSLLQKPLGGLTEVTYRVHGPWDNPQIDDQGEGTAQQEPRLPELPVTAGGSNKAD